MKIKADKGKKEKLPKISRLQITNCPHTSETFYAKGLCGKCYHTYGRSKMATNCEHGDRISYARGICKLCYLKQYHASRKQAV